MIWFAIVAATIVSVAAFLRMPFLRLTFDIVEAARKSFHVVSSSRISDHWKGKILPRYAGRIFKDSIVLLSCLLALALPIVVGHGIVRFASLDLFGAMMSWWGIALSLATATVQVTLVRALWGGDPSYGPLQRLLHYGVLAVPAVGEALFDIERKRNKRASEAVAAGHHVFVSGLARAGTTVLMRALHETGQFSSLTYADMPFVLAPGLWSRIRGKLQTKPKRERAHSDGVLVDEESPEALDEVFFRTFARADFVGAKYLKPHRLDAELQGRFCDYIGIVLSQKGGNRYLSKNNNNVLRLDSLCDLFPNAVVLVPFRAPLQQAGSLLNQHRVFSRRQREDGFTRRYMGWLGHHEFGLDHRRIVFDEDTYQNEDPERLEYWLEQWVAIYRQLLACALARPGQVVLVSYELLCERKVALWPRLCQKVKIEPRDTPEFRAAAERPLRVTDDPLREAATKLYDALNSQCLEQFEIDRNFLQRSEQA